MHYLPGEGDSIVLSFAPIGMYAPVTTSAGRPPSPIVIIAAAAIGTFIEWYDLLLAIILAPVLAQNLFPENDARFLETLAVVGTSYLIRPLGALLFGRMGDRQGRRKPFLTSLLLMGGATFCIGLIPSFEAVGWYAPFLLLVCRLLQGLAISGEYTGAIIYVAEQAPERRRGFFTGFIQATVPLGLLLCLLVVYSTRRLLGNEAFDAYGWRIPFLFSAFLIALGWFIRTRLPESLLFAQMQEQGSSSSMPVKDSFRTRRNRMLLLIAIFGGCAAQSTLMQTTHFVTLFYLQRTVLLPVETVLIIVGTATIISSPLLQFFGSVSDKLGRKPIIISGLLLSIFFMPLVFHFMHPIGNPEGLAAVHTVSLTAMVQLTGLLLCLHVSCAMVYGPVGAFILELFPTQIRYTSMGFAYNVGNGVLGGLTPFITELFVRMIVPISAAFVPFAGLIYPLTLISIAIFVNAFTAPETYRKSLTT